MIAVAEGIAGRKLDRREVRWRSCPGGASKAAQLWESAWRTGSDTRRPGPGSTTFFHIAPIVTMRGTEKCNAYYRLLLDELKDRVAKGIGGIANERVRLLWDNLPIWFNVREISTLLAEHGFNFVCTTYTNAWAEAGCRINPADPIDSTARAYMEVYLNRDLANRLER